MILALLLGCLGLPACGSGDDPTVAAPAGAVLVAAAPEPVDVPIRLAAAPAGDAAAPTAQVGVAAALVALGTPNPDAGATRRGLGATDRCPFGYEPPPGLDRDTPAPMPAAGGTFYTEAELATWRQRVQTGPFVDDGDFMPGSPGDWARIVANTRAFLLRGEATWTADTSYLERALHGTLARDAAYHALVLGQTASRDAVRQYLLDQAGNPLNALHASLCIKGADGVTLDGFPHAASWLMRYLVTYDAVRATLPAADRVVIDNFVRRNAYFLAAHVDTQLAMIFPRRELGDYSQRREDAAPATAAAAWWSKRFDSNGDCKADDKDPASPLPAFAYVRRDGSRGPQLSVLSQWYNNRRSSNAAAAGAAGVLLGDPVLVASAKRYFMEWLAYGVWPDGSQGEYARNGDYCIPGQGAIYSQSNIQGAVLVARALARQGDRSLADFSTTEGLFGSQGAAPGKSLALAAATYVNLFLGRLDWYFDEPWKASAEPRPATALGNNVVHYMGGARAMDDYHELGMLPAAGLLPAAQIDKLVLRDRRATALPFPGATGNPVPTGYGVWTDIFNALPAALLLRP